MNFRIILQMPQWTKIVTPGSHKSRFEQKSYLCINCVRNKYNVLLLIIPVQHMNGTNEVWKKLPLALAKLSLPVCSFVKEIMQ